MDDKEFNYEDLWKKSEKLEEDSLAKNTLSEMSRGEPRKGIRGKYIRKKNNITKRQIRNSYIKGVKEIKNSEN